MGGYSDDDVRLAGGGRSYGRVEVFRHGQWGTICDVGWDDKGANTVCRQLGYHQGEAHRNSRYGRGKGPIWLSNVKCDDRDKHLTDCSYDINYLPASCTHNHDAGVKCSFQHLVFGDRMVGSGFGMVFLIFLICIIYGCKRVHTGRARGNRGTVTSSQGRRHRSSILPTITGTLSPPTGRPGGGSGGGGGGRRTTRTLSLFGFINRAGPPEEEVTETVSPPPYSEVATDQPPSQPHTSPDQPTPPTYESLYGPKDGGRETEHT